MRDDILTTLAAAILCSGLSCAAADAAMQTASVHGASIQRVTNVCGSNGCAPVQTKRYTRPPKPGSVAAHHI